MSTAAPKKLADQFACFSDACQSLLGSHWFLPSMFLVALAICAARSIGVIA